MHSWKPDSEAQMLAHIKSLPEGPLKDSLLSTYIKTVKGDIMANLVSRNLLYFWILHMKRISKPI
jgi:hypothetical protein